jgi:hypothetical protein
MLNLISYKRTNTIIYKYCQIKKAFYGFCFAVFPQILFLKMMSGF